MTLVKLIIEFMKEAGNFRQLNGEQKKDYVIKRLLDEIEFSVEVEEFIEDFLTLIIDVEKGKIKINKKAVLKMRFC